MELAWYPGGRSLEDFLPADISEGSQHRLELEWVPE
jgi:hypothetical protein